MNKISTLILVIFLLVFTRHFYLLPDHLLVIDEKMSFLNCLIILLTILIFYTVAFFIINVTIDILRSKNLNTYIDRHGIMECIILYFKTGHLFKKFKNIKGNLSVLLIVISLLMFFSYPRITFYYNYIGYSLVEDISIDEIEPYREKVNLVVKGEKPSNQDDYIEELRSEEDLGEMFLAITDKFIFKESGKITGYEVLQDSSLINIIKMEFLFLFENLLYVLINIILPYVAISLLLYFRKFKVDKK